MSRIQIAAGLTLPVDVVTQTVAIIAKRRAGKSYTMRRIVEQLLSAGQQVVLVDPKGDQWGLRSSADGRSPGFPVVILGGEHGDVPLESQSGELVAKLVVEDQVSAVLDLSLFRKHELATFMTGFLENLYRLKAREKFRTRMMLVIDEADAVAPQRPQRGEERMLGAAEDIVRRGGQRGIGCVLVTQRSAVLNKNVLTQAQILVALRTIAPQDLDAMNAWVEVHGTREEQRTLMASLPSLPVGDAWFWSPGWPTNDGIFKRVHVLPITTFDSGATPTGSKPVEPKKLADIDLDAVKRQMADLVAKAEANDPAALKKRLAEATKRLSDADRWTTEREREMARLKAKSGLSDADMKQLRAFAANISSAMNTFGTVLDKTVASMLHAIDTVQSGLKKDLTNFADALGKLEVPLVSLESRKREYFAGRNMVVSTPLKRDIDAFRHDAAVGDLHVPRERADMPPGERAVLTAAAMWEDGVSRDQLGVLTGYKRSSRDAYIARMLPKGLVVIRSDGRVVATDQGVAALGSDYAPLPTGPDLLAWWRERLPKGEREVLDVLVSSGGRPVERETVDDKTGFKRSSRDAYLSRLASRRLVETAGPGLVQAAKELF